MNVEVVLLPALLRPEEVVDRTVVVFDVLRATTTMAAALAAGVAEIRIFGHVDDARAAAEALDGPRLLCGEQNCLPPPGFDLGNSPGQFDPARHAGRVVLMATTNGTRAILAAREAPAVLTGALVNATAVAQAAASFGRDVTLLCAGTNGQVAMEDLLGAGAVQSALMRHGYAPAGDSALIASRLFDASATNLAENLRRTRGGLNVIDAGLAADIDFASRLDAIDAVGVVQSVLNTTRVVRFH